jgi:hypothetical protein
MKVSRSAIHRLEVDVTCGCKANGEYDDEACKKQKGTTTFTACEKHKEAAGVDMLEMMLIEVVDKEARELVIAPPEPRVHPRTLALQQAEEAGDADPAAAAAPARTLRTSGSTGATRAPAAPAAPARSAPGSHRPSRPAGGGGGGGGFARRSDPGSRLSPAAARLAGGSKVASSTRVAGGNANPSGISFGGDLDIDMDEVPEDSRVTRLLEVTNALGGDDEGDFDDDGDIEL